ncbi:lipopolysaccharide biosynthesis protein [Photobacterium kasasachensis]|uniref:lipopolysaccharide biosynthesis protein n=1 Tax=Photobacterium kasasachensis TaxID=2910240 RepID=UPI003D0F1879
MENLSAQSLHQEDALSRLKKAFITGIWATLASISVSFLFKIWLAQWVPKGDLALYNSVVDIISLSLILMTGFRSSMVVSYSQTQNDRDIINIFRFSLIVMVLITWGLVIPYIKHELHIDVGYLELVGVIFSMGLKVYFTNLVAMYRLYSISNKVTWLEPVGNVALFLLCYYALRLEALSSLFYSMSLSSLGIAAFMYIRRRKEIATRPLATVHLDPALISYVKKSFTASLEAGASILMIYITVLLTISYFSIDELGDFQVIVRPVFTYMTMLFVFPIYRFVLPELAVCVRKGQHDQIKAIRRWVFKVAGLVSAVFFVTMFLWGEHIVLWVFPAEYKSAVPVLFHFSIFFIFMMLNAYQLAYIKAHGNFTQSLFIRLSGIITLVGAFYLLSLFTTNVVAIIVALGLGYLMMFLLSSVAEYRLVRRYRDMVPA